MPISELVPADYNPRRISAKRLEGLRASLRRFGNVQTIVFNRRLRRIVGGHQRVTLLAEAGVKETGVTVVDLDDKDEHALNSAPNNPKITGEFDDDLLQPMLAQLQLDDEDLFADVNLNEVLKGETDAPDSDAIMGGLEYCIIIDCSSEDQWAELLARFESEGIECKGQIV